MRPNRKRPGCPGEGPEFNCFHNLYSLIPRFQPSTFPSTGRYDIYCNLPPIQIIDENGKFTAVEAGKNPRNRRRFRIFDVQDTLRRRKKSRGMGVRPGLISLFPGGIGDGGPVNYWRLLVPCHVMLYLFIDVLELYDFDYTVPEVELAMQIYERLKEIRRNNDKEPRARRKNDLDHPTQNPSPVGTPKNHKNCRHPRRGNTLTYCTMCWTLSPTNFPPLDLLQIDALNSEDMTPSRPAHARTQHARPRITRIPSYRKTAYPTPSSLPKPEHDFGGDYFSSAPSGTNKPFTGRSFTSGASSPHSPEFSKLSSVANTAASSSNEDSDYQPSEESENTDEWETDSDISSDGTSQGSRSIVNM
ncbi:hypothetical protein C8J57DRAFT_1672695 [Mycena rebaudengoi]|nr:hypothetical protein C8J57DRAFT_1672695 [Mycena rebaudengoi]